MEPQTPTPPPWGSRRTLAGLPLTSWSYSGSGPCRPGRDPGSSASARSWTTAWRRTRRTCPRRRRCASWSSPLTRPARVAAAVRSDRPSAAWLPWDVGQVAWRADAGAAVLDLSGHSAAEARRSAGGCDEGASGCHRVWGKAWRRVPVLVATEGPAQLARLTGREPAAVAGLVAVTRRPGLPGRGRMAGPAGRRSPGAADPRGHPSRHRLARPTRACRSGSRRGSRTTSGSPVRRSRRDRGRGAARSGGPRSRRTGGLPTGRRLRGGRSGPARAYAGAWLACRLDRRIRGPARPCRRVPRHVCWRPGSRG